MKRCTLFVSFLLLASCSAPQKTSTASSEDLSSSSSYSSVTSSLAPSSESLSLEPESSEPSSSIVPSSSESHVHTYEDGYSYDETLHWREATCGHDERIEVGEHLFYDDYRVENDEIIVIKKCEVCGYFEEHETLDERQFDEAITFPSGASGIGISDLGDHNKDPIINYPRQIDGFPLVSINLSLSWTNKPSEGHSAIFIPNTVTKIAGALAHAGSLDVFFEVTLAEYLALDVTSYNFTNGRFNLHLLDDSGAFYLVQDLVLPSGLSVFSGTKYFGSSTIKTIACNDDLSSFEISGCDFLADIHFNEGLLSITGLYGLPRFHHFLLPSSLNSVGYCSLNHLYTVTIAEGTSSRLSLNFPSSCPRLIAVFDHRNKEGRTEASVASRVIYREDNEDDFALYRSGDFLLYQNNDVYCLLDYFGEEFEVTLPESFLIDKEEIASYTMLDTFLYSGILSGAPRGTYSFEDEEILLHEHFIARLIVPKALTKILHTTIYRYYTENIYFDMSLDEAKARFEGEISDYFLQADMWLKLYCKQDEEYVCFFPDK